jgi:hypothetical protein
MTYANSPIWTILQGGPFITVGTGSGFNFSPNTPGTTTGGRQEAINYAIAHGVNVWVTPGTYTDSTGISFAGAPQGFHYFEEHGAFINYSGSGDAVLITSGNFLEITLGQYFGQNQGNGIHINPNGAILSDSIVFAEQLAGFSICFYQDFHSNGTIMYGNRFAVKTINMQNGNFTTTNRNYTGVLVASSAAVTTCESYFNFYDFDHIFMPATLSATYTAIGIQDGDTVLYNQSAGDYPQYSWWRFNIEGFGTLATSAYGLKSYAFAQSYMANFGVVGTSYAMTFYTQSAQNHIFCASPEISTPATWQNFIQNVDSSNIIKGSFYAQMQRIFSQPNPPAATGSGSAVQNVYSVRFRVFQVGMSGTHIIDANGTDHSLGVDPPMLTLLPGESIYYATTKASSWTWLMEP